MGAGQQRVSERGASDIEPQTPLRDPPKEAKLG